MDFYEIIKNCVLNIMENISFCDIYIGTIIDNENLKIKIDDKIILTENEIIRTSKFLGKFLLGQKLIMIKQGGGQKYFIIDSMPKE